MNRQGAKEQWREVPRHRVVYRSQTIRTLSQARSALAHLPHPVLSYCQIVALHAPERDADFHGCIRVDREKELAYVSFPKGLTGYVTRIQNSRGCRMVTYWKDPDTGFLQEVEITPDVELLLPSRSGGEDPVLRIYTRGVEEITMRFDVYLLRTGGGRARL